MHSTPKIGSFMTLRANGWSLDKIAKKINVSKSTLWAWDIKHQNEIHLLKHMQLERVQEQYLPSYEEELKSLSTQLARVDQALALHDLAAMGPAFLMQMSLQLRDRLSKMRQQAPLRTVQYGPVEPLPVTGCVTKDEHYPWIAGDAAIEPVEDAAEAATAAPPAAEAAPPTPTGPKPPTTPPPAPPARGRPIGSNKSSTPATIGEPHLNGHRNGSSKPHHNGANGNGSSSDRSDSTIQPVNDLTSPQANHSTPAVHLNPCSSVVHDREHKTEQNRTKSEGGRDSDLSPSKTYKDEN